MSDDKDIVETVPSTNVHRDGRPEQAETELAGQAIRFPLNERPDEEWRHHFGGWKRLQDYFARIRFEDNSLVLFLGAGVSSLEPGLDEVEQAIRSANEQRLEEVEHSQARSESARARREADMEKIERALDTWAEKHGPA